MAERYALRIAKPVVKTLKKLPLKVFKQIMIKALSLQSEPKPQDCKALKGYPGGYRVDQGEYRILYTIEDETVSIFRIGKRNDSEVYRNL
ncbi:type II toxin-antitoxin system RelE/ParE family toxin (plasmid) [Acaryochloris sp. 'Moss Beach']|uniref:type II toxin-antitoxin system RelE family toxin n=1 Tax=Acaryochloris TaxID=155977 RepID=UPI001F3504B4|nr:type II toxin-antitoxin system RelE/ParE family toxin [Acaryochloris sp. 'Moss Beach']UJB72285.1 type II toxin-antitoxin system RelE/ParE family toxin [Acaryochloris sp. 'Moss Beach']